jgi:hypothetical protein
MFIFVSLPMKMIYYSSAIAHMSLYSGSAVDFIFIGRQTSAHHKADGTQVSKDVYDEWKRRNTLQRSINKRQVVLATLALAGAAAEPTSDYEGSPMEAPALVVTVE